MGYHVMQDMYNSITNINVKVHKIICIANYYFTVAIYACMRYAL